MLTLATVLAQQTQPVMFKIPVYNFDVKGHPPLGLTTAALPKGFTKGKKDGEITSPYGTLSLSVGKSETGITQSLRNPEAKPGEEWSTLRLTQWTGWRNRRGNKEIYKVSWSKFRLNFELNYKSEKDVTKLRAGIHRIVDTLVLT